jgi:mono/diheme cytochrome c family protein
MARKKFLFVGAPIFSLCCLAFALPSAPPISSRQDHGDDEPVKDGKWHYTRNCSGCHNDNGDGRGKTILALGLTARDFKQGGFAFGDSREAITRTINTGVPGRSPMPPFKGVLTDDEISLVVDYVFTLMPPRKDERPKNTILAVQDRPVVARGKLPPLAEHGADIPRGLLIGTPQGMTFEYDVEGVKLLAVRLGAFADRQDWHDRGGGYLKPLGQVVWQNDDDVAGLTGSLPFGDDLLQDADDSGVLMRVLESTSVREGLASVTYAVRNRGGAGPVGLHCSETVRTDALSVGPGFTRTWKFALTPGTELVVPVAGASNGPWKLGPHRGDPPARWWVRERRDGGAEAALVQSSHDCAVPDPSSQAGRLEFQFFEYTESKTATPIQFSATLVTVPKWSSELGDKLMKELVK